MENYLSSPIVPLMSIRILRKIEELGCEKWWAYRETAGRLAGMKTFYDFSALVSLSDDVQ
jgi:hypothetical protein